MMNAILGNTCSHAHVSGSKLVLNFVDAETPVVWVIDLQANPTLLLKVEEADNGLFVLQKVTGSNGTNTVEDLAYYKKRGHAMRAMDKATKALGHQKCSGFGAMKCLVKLATVIIIAGLVYTQWDNITSYIPNTNMSTSEQSTASQNTEPRETATQPAPVQPSKNPAAVGVPMSADDFLKARRPKSSGSIY